LKKTVLSVLPYVISFGGLPWAVYLSAGKNPPLWLYLGFILLSSAFHFLNVLKDLEMDISQGVLGLPQRVGKRASLVIAALLVVAWIIFLQV
jgi:4-hydroxybenzoate polyprenyltransferase